MVTQHSPVPANDALVAASSLVTQDSVSGGVEMSTHRGSCGRPLPMCTERPTTLSWSKQHFAWHHSGLLDRDGPLGAKTSAEIAEGIACRFEVRLGVELNPLAVICLLESDPQLADELMTFI